MNDPTARQSLAANRSDPSSGSVVTTAEAGRSEGGHAPLPPFELTAYRILDRGWGAGWELKPAAARRDWMDEHKHAYHCLPLVVANQWGWEIRCPTEAVVSWDGSPHPAGLKVEAAADYESAIKSQFGQGIVTFSPPWLFRTPRGWDLFAKGPANRWAANCVPLEGVIETWWLPYTFTLNWKLIEPGTVVFAKGQSLAQLVPVPHGTFQQATAVERPLDAAPELAAAMTAWREERQRRANEPEQKHLLYRKAPEVEGHLVRVPVPPVEGERGRGP